MKALYWIFAVMSIAEATLNLAVISGQMKQPPATNRTRAVNMAWVAVLAWLLIEAAMHS